MSNHKFHQPVQWAKQKLDGWISSVTGAGISGVDVSTSYTASGSIVAPTTAKSIYGSSPLAKIIVDKPASDATRSGYVLEIPDNPALAAEITSSMEDLKAPAAFTRALQVSRLFGGSAIYLITDDIDLAQPLRIQSKITGLHVFSAGLEITATTEYVSDIKSPQYALPAYYRISSILPGIETNMPRVHYSRFIRFCQPYVDTQTLLMRQGFGPSILEGLIQSIQAYETGHDSASTLLYDFSAGVLTIPGLSAAMAAVTETNTDGIDLISARLKVMSRLRSVHKSVVLDGGGNNRPAETFQRITTPLTGMPDILDRLAQRVSAVSQIPISILFGVGATGLLNNGSESTRAYNSYVESLQTSQLRPAIEQLATILFSRVEPENWDVVFAPLYTPTAKELADAYLTTAQGDEKYLNTGCLTSNEIRQFRFSSKPTNIVVTGDIGYEEPQKETTEPPVEAPTEAPTGDSVQVNDFVKERNGKWVVLSRKGKVLGIHPTKALAEKQLAAIEVNKHKR